MSKIVNDERTLSDFARDGLGLVLDETSSELFLLLNQLKQTTDTSKILGELESLLVLLEKVQNQILGNAVVLTLGVLFSENEEALRRIEAMATHSSPLVRERFCHVLGYSGKNGLIFGDEVKSLATDEDANVRDRAVQSLRRLGEHGLQGVASIIQNALSDPDPSVQNTAIENLL